MERDWLTGALNRAGLDRVARKLAGHAADRQPASIMMLDVDRFKALNDSHGHAAGDTALRMLADIARKALGEQGHVARWGGDEFVCLLPATPIAQARAIATRIADQFAQTMAQYGPAASAATVSIGVVEADAATPIADLIARADQAMYGAKADRGKSAAYDQAA
nr:GGDEF domain-containing protein [Sphingomonas faeni]